MGKRKPTTPRSRVKNALRQVWLRSRERAAALKRTGYCCERCGVKQTMAKGKEVRMEVHHRYGIDWDGVVDIIFARVLVPPEQLQVLCKDCHKQLHKEEADD